MGATNNSMAERGKKQGAITVKPHGLRVYVSKGTLPRHGSVPFECLGTSFVWVLWERYLWERYLWE